MKAVQVQGYGGAEKLEIHEIPTPIPSDNRTLIKVKSVSINPFDIKLIKGAMSEMIPLTFPFTIGGDFSGVNEATGEEIYGSGIILGSGSGAFAEYVAVNNDKIAKKPANIGFPDAAALPLAGVSAQQALIDEIKLQKDQKVLIHGGAGGIGHLAIQIAKSLGAFVATTVSVGDIDFVKSLGADLVVDYQNQIFEEIIKDYDAVFDTVGGETLDKSLKVVKKDAVIVSMVGKGDSVISQKTNVNKVSLERLTKLVENGAVKPHVQVFEFKKVSDAWLLQTTHPQGKIVITI